MSKLLSLLKFNIKADLDAFNGRKKKILTIFIFGYLTFAVGVYAYLIAKPLSQMNLTYIVIALFYIMAVLISFMASINKSQGMLFLSRDNDMLFAMPIKRNTILASRIIRLILFQYIWTLFVMLPTLGVYIYFENPGVLFYVVSIIMLLLLPVIPMVIGSILGYIIQTISSYFRRKNVVQTILMIVLMIGIFYTSFSLQKLLPKLIENAKSIFDMLSKIYYPLGVYISNIFKLDILDMAIYIGINTIVFGVFIYIFSIGYYKIISKLGETHTVSNYKVKSLNSTPVFKSLVIKDLKRYFSSAIYVMNTIFGPAIFLISAIYVGYKGEQGLITIMSQASNEIPASSLSSITAYIPVIVIMIAMFCISTAAITASSISIEGKTFWFVKSLPVTTKQILFSKILLNILIVLPIMLIGSIIYIIGLNLSIFNALVLIATCVILTLFVSVLGIVINLIWPKMNAANDTVVVKQSMSAMVSILGGLALIFMPLVIYIIFDINNIDRYILICLGIFSVLNILLLNIALKYGKKRIIEID